MSNRMMHNQNAPKINTEQALLNSIKIYLPDLNLNSYDLKNPTQHIVCNFYTSFLEELGANTSNVVQIQINQMTLISHVDMYNATVPIFNLFYSVKYFLNNVGISDFSPSDLVNPVPRRTLTHFSALMHFLTYCDETISGLQSQLQEVTKLREQRDELYHKIEILRGDINRNATERVKRRERCKELEKSNEKDKIDLNKICQEKESLKQTMENIKKMVSHYEEKDSQIIRTIRNMENKNKDLTEMIVRSPEKLKTDLEQLESKKKELVETVRCSKIQLEEKKKLTNLLIKEREKQENRQQKLKDILETEELRCEKAVDNDKLLNECAKILEQNEELKHNISNIRHKLKALQQNLNEFKLRQEKKESDNNILLPAEKEYKMLIEKQELRSQEIYRMRTQIKELNDDFDKLNDALKKYVLSFLEEHEYVASLEKQLIQKYTLLQNQLSMKNNINSKYNE
ncbi:hypothetical protein PGB90_003940 [Kerria lacca]